MDPKFGNYSLRHHTDAIACRKCGKTGTVVWDDISRRNGSAPEQIGIDGPFFERLSKKPPYPIELVCRSCGGVAITAYPSTSLHEREKYN
jgi:hypothetical protein